MRKYIVAFLTAVVGMLTAATVASADNGPHGNYTFTTDACAGCHRVHTAQGEKFLKTSDKLTLCFSCHDGTGTVLDVWDGARLGARLTPGTNGTGPRDGNPTGIIGALRGGGMVYARIDSGNSTTPAVAFANNVPGEPVNSAHVKFGSIATGTGNGLVSMGYIWGNGTTGQGKVTSGIVCSDCHNPMGGGTWRILRPRPNQSDATSDVKLADLGTFGDADSKVYTTPNYWLTYQVSAPGPLLSPPREDLAKWCTQCHSRYLSGSSAGTGDPVFNFKHYSDGTRTIPAGSSTWPGAPYTATFSPFCLQCHVSHGSNAVMSAGSFSASVPWPGTTTPRGNESTNLKINQRGTCVGCHGTFPP